MKVEDVPVGKFVELTLTAHRTEFKVTGTIESVSTSLRTGEASSVFLTKGGMGAYYWWLPEWCIGRKRIINLEVIGHGVC